MFIFRTSGLVVAAVGYLYKHSRLFPGEKVFFPLDFAGSIDAFWDSINEAFSIIKKIESIEYLTRK
jgi:hypothetical protein